MLNKCILMGRLTADPELRRTQSGTAVTSFTLAVNRNFSRSQEQQADFIDIVAWQSTAEFAAKWFKKGQLVAVAGRLQMRNWEDKQGNKRRSYEVIAEEVHFAESKKDSVRGDENSALPFDLPPVTGAFDELSDDDDDELPF